tara:strand:+ start:891 stop:1529 length:639 start_codon:yes stop_codon:yes gene_type:complete
MNEGNATEGAFDGNAAVTGWARWTSSDEANQDTREAEAAAPEVLREASDNREFFNETEREMSAAVDDKAEDITKLVTSTAGGIATSAPVAKVSQNAFSQFMSNPATKQVFKQGGNLAKQGLNFGARRIAGMAAGGAVGFGPGAAIGLVAPDAIPALMKQGVGALDRYNNKKNGNPLGTLQRRYPDDHPGKLLTRAMQGEHRQPPDLTKHSFR